MSKFQVYKAQWPLATNLPEPMILVYPDGGRSEKWFYLPATKENRRVLFKDKYVRVYFSGRVTATRGVEVDKFVRHEEWL